MATQTAVREWSKERSLELLGPEVMADIAASVATAPPPSPELLAQVRRMFAAVPTRRTQ
jgi:hypothetical protein